MNKKFSEALSFAWPLREMTYAGGTAEACPGHVRNSGRSSNLLSSILYQQFKALWYRNQRESRNTWTAKTGEPLIFTRDRICRRKRAIRHDHSTKWSSSEAWTSRHVPRLESSCSLSSLFPSIMFLTAITFLSHLVCIVVYKIHLKIRNFQNNIQKVHKCGKFLVSSLWRWFFRLGIGYLEIAGQQIISIQLKSSITFFFPENIWKQAIFMSRFAECMFALSWKRITGVYGVESLGLMSGGSQIRYIFGNRCGTDVHLRNQLCHSFGSVKLRWRKATRRCFSLDRPHAIVWKKYTLRWG